MALRREPEPHPGVQAAARNAACVEGISQSDRWRLLTDKSHETRTYGAAFRRVDLRLRLRTSDGGVGAGLRVRSPIRSVIVATAPVAALPYAYAAPVVATAPVAALP
jgi:hypothetical protein